MVKQKLVVNLENTFFHFKPLKHIQGTSKHCKTVSETGKYKKLSFKLAKTTLWQKKKFVCLL